MNNKGKQVKIIWNDALIIYPKRKGNTPLLKKKEDNIPSKMETTGLFETEYDDYFLIKNPVTINTKTEKRHPEQTPTFYLIPKGMVDIIEEI